MDELVKKQYGFRQLNISRETLLLLECEAVKTIPHDGKHSVLMLTSKDTEQQPEANLSDVSLY